MVATIQWTGLLDLHIFVLILLISQFTHCVITHTPHRIATVCQEHNYNGLDRNGEDIYVVKKLHPLESKPN